MLNIFRHNSLLIRPELAMVTLIHALIRNICPSYFRIGLSVLKMAFFHMMSLLSRPRKVLIPILLITLRLCPVLSMIIGLKPFRLNFRNLPSKVLGLNYIRTLFQRERMLSLVLGSSRSSDTQMVDSASSRLVFVSVETCNWKVLISSRHTLPLSPGLLSDSVWSSVQSWIYKLFKLTTLMPLHKPFSRKTST